MNSYEFTYKNIGYSTVSPSVMQVVNTELGRFFCKYFLDRAISRFDFKLPELWDADFFRYCIFGYGYGCVINTDKYGVIFQNCSLAGQNVYYRPTDAIVANPLLHPVKARIGVQTEIIKLMPNYSGIMDIVRIYAAMSALTIEAFQMNIINSKLAFVFACDNKNMAESFKQLYDKVIGGDPAVFADKSLFDDKGNLRMQFFNQDLKSMFIAPDLLDCLRMIENFFDTEIGYPNANTAKKERMLTDEVNANNEETFALCSLWLRTLKESFEKVNRMFNLNLSVELYKDDTIEGGDQIEEGNI